MTDTVTSVRPEPPRDSYGRYLIKPPDGGRPKAYTRATTIADTLDDRYNLELWKIRMAALGLVERPDLHAVLASLPKDDKKAINDVCGKAIEAAKGSAGANVGTALHRFTERLNQGEQVIIPAPWDKDIAAYQQALTVHNLVVDRKHLERIVVLHELGIAGTFDAILNGYITDLKTGATLDFSWGAIAIQLALYAHADTLYDPVSETHEPMPPVDHAKAIVIHLPAGKATCTLYQVDIAAGWEATQHALWARGWRKRKDLAVPMVVGGGDVAPRETTGEHPSVTPTGKLDKLRSRYRKLPETKRGWVMRHLPDFQISPESYELGLALVRFAELDVDDDLLRVAVTKAVGRKLSIRKTVADILTTVTLEQAQALSGIAVAIHDGRYAIRYTVDGVHIDAA